MKSLRSSRLRTAGIMGALLLITAPALALNSPQASAEGASSAGQVPGARSMKFNETGYEVKGLFLEYWEGHGGLMQQGFPISGVRQETSFADRDMADSTATRQDKAPKYAVQYFERAVFEYHPENQAPYNVLLAPLGSLRYKEKYPYGAPNQFPNRKGHYFTETMHWVGGKFWQYWQQHGGLMQMGYPLSDEIVERSELNNTPYTAQYFERAVLEYHPENRPPYDILQAQLGTLYYKQMGKAK